MKERPPTSAFLFCRWPLHNVRAEADIDIEFVTQNGDLPLIKSDTTFLLMDVSRRIEVAVC